MPSQAQNQKHKFWFFIFRPKITNTYTNPNTITNINTEITNTNVRSMIFPFKITNQIQILDLWFSLSKSQTQTHMIENLRRTEPRKKKMENEVEWDQRQRGWNEAVPVLNCLWAYGRVSERAKRWRGRSSHVRQWVRELRQLGTAMRARAVVRLWAEEMRGRGVSWREERRGCELNAEMKWGMGNVRVYNYVYIWGYFSNYICNRVSGRV